MLFYLSWIVVSSTDDEDGDGNDNDGDDDALMSFK